MITLNVNHISYIIKKIYKFKIILNIKYKI